MTWSPRLLAQFCLISHILSLALKHTQTHTETFFFLLALYVNLIVTHKCCLRVCSQEIQSMRSMTGGGKDRWRGGAARTACWISNPPALYWESFRICNDDNSPNYRPRNHWMLINYVWYCQGTFLLSTCSLEQWFKRNIMREERERERLLLNPSCEFFSWCWPWAWEPVSLSLSLSRSIQRWNRWFDCRNKCVMLVQDWWIYTCSFNIWQPVVMGRIYVWQNDGRKHPQNWHLAKCEQGTNQWQLRRLSASITAVFGLTTAEQVEAGQLSSNTCSCSKLHNDEAVESNFDCICNSCVCVHTPVCACLCANIVGEHCNSILSSQPANLKFYSDETAVLCTICTVFK